MHHNHHQFWLGATGTLTILVIGIFTLQLLPTSAALPLPPLPSTASGSQTFQTPTKVSVITINNQSTPASSQPTFINLRGKIIADSNVRYSAGTAATVTKINVVRGQSVKKGDVVMELGGNKGNKHALELAYEQATINKQNLQKTMQNTTTSTAIAIRQAEQQRNAVDVSSRELATSLQLTRNAGRFAVEGATLALTNLQNTTTRSQTIRDLSANQSDVVLEQSAELAEIALQNSARSLIIGLDGSVLPLLNGISQITNDRDIHDDVDELEDIIDDLKNYRELSDYEIVYKIDDFSNSLYDLLDLLENSTRNLQSINNANTKPLTDAWKQLSGTITGSVTASIAQLTNTRNLVSNGPTNSELQLAPTDLQISGSLDQQRALALTIEQAKNASALQEQALSSQIQSLAQQKISANLGIEAAKAGAKAQKDSLQGQLTLADKQIEQAALQLIQLQVIASSDGYVIDIPVTRDEEITVGRELITLYGETASYIRLALNPTDRDQLRVGTKVAISLSTDNNDVPATITKIAPVADQTGNIPVDATFDEDNLPLGLAPGTNVIARATITPNTTEPITQAIFVPITTVIIDNGQNYLWLYNNGTAQKTPVVLGPTQSDQVQILTPLTNNQIITGPLTELQDKQAVTIQ